MTNPKPGSKASLLAEVARLETTLARETRAFQAMAEWFTCEGRGHATTTLDVMVDGSAALRVVVHGITRAAGGVCVVEQLGSDWRDFPRYLDDLIAEWSRDCAAEIRDAARLLLQRREQYCKVAS